jgi:hypothetical protein
MILQGTYFFERFNGLGTRITDPTMELVFVHDSPKEKRLTAWFRFTSGNVSFDQDFEGFEYPETWEDSDVYAWALQELETHNTQINEMDS